MSNRINTNISSQVAQQKLAKSSAQLQSSLTRLSTGLRINGGKDDPAGLISSTNLRRDITSIRKAIVNSERATQLIATADSALGEVSTLLNDIRGLVAEASNSGGLSEEQIVANQVQLDSSLEAIDRIAQVTTFQGVRLLDGTLDFQTDATLSEFQSLSVEQANLGTANSLAVDIQINSAATQAQLNATGLNVQEATVDIDGTIFTILVDDAADFDALLIDIDVSSSAASSAAYASASNTLTISVDNNDNAITADSLAAAIGAATGDPFNVTVTHDGNGSTTVDGAAVTGATDAGTVTEVALLDDVVFQVSGRSGAEVLVFDAGTRGTQIAQAVNLISDAIGIQANLDGDNQRVEFQSTDYGSKSFVDIEVITEGQNGDFESGLQDAATSTAASRAGGTDIAAVVNGAQADGDGNTLSINTTTLDLTLTALAGSTSDISFNIQSGGALFQVGSDVVSNQQVRLGITGVNTGTLGGANGRLFELASGGAKDLATDTVGAAKIVDEVINQVATLRGRLGAFQRTTLESNVASLQDTLSNLTEAESSIRDADFSAETADLTRAQILVQSGTSVLAIANQTPQNVLALLR